MATYDASEKLFGRRGVILTTGGGSIMRALRFARTGALENLGVEIIDRPVPGPGEALVRVQAAAINPSDVKNVLGKMELTTVPRTPGRDFAGVVEQGPSTLIGRLVFGTGRHVVLVLLRGDDS
jgi:NADPH2:quinone reductase